MVVVPVLDDANAPLVFYGIVSDVVVNALRVGVVKYAERVDWLSVVPIISTPYSCNERLIIGTLVALFSDRALVALERPVDKRAPVDVGCPLAPIKTTCLPFGLAGCPVVHRFLQPLLDDWSEALACLAIRPLALRKDCAAAS